MKVSIIIPVYNTEKYLKRCIESCLSQSLEEIEMILIDDCSKDGSRDVIKDYATKYPNKVKYIFQEENHRQGAARNRGMEMAQGEYIAFVDSDDWIEPDMCEAMYNKAKEFDADMVGSDYFLSWDDRDKKILLEWHDEDVGIMTKRKKEYVVSVCGMFWARIYRRSFLEEKKLSFPEKIFYEDAFFNFYSILLSDKMAKIDKPFYHYYQENQSTVRNRNNPGQYERIRLAEEILGYGRAEKELADYKEIIDYKYLHMQCSNLIYICLGQFDAPDREIMSHLANSIKNDIPNVFKSKAYKKMLFEFRFYVRLNNISPRLCIFAYRHNLFMYLSALINKLRRAL